MTGTLVVVCGTPGVGKTTVARAVAGHVDGEVIRTDVVRKDLFADPEYTDAEERRVYESLFERARERIERGDAVVLDGTFYRERYRREAADLADETGATFDLVRVECAEAVVRKRIAEREDDASDADFEIHCHYRNLFEPIERDHVTVDNSDGLDATRDQVARHFGSEVTPEERV